jgi:hypothetical protein
MNEVLPKTIVLITVVILAGLSWIIQDAHAQAGNGILEPADGDSVSGIVIIQGSAVHPQFLRYELAFLQESRPGADWIVFAQGDQPVQDDILAVWDTTIGQPVSPVFPDGQYRLRLRVVRDDYNYNEFFVSGLSIANLSLTPSPTATLTTTLRATPTLASSAELEATRRAATGVLPTLTPFPTPSPPPVTDSGILGLTSPAEDEEEQGGLLGRIVEIETARFGRAFWFGVTVVIFIFAALALYVLLRGAWRRVRRLIRQRSS